MTNYASISEAIAKKLYEAECAVESLEIVIDEHTQPSVIEFEERYIRGENVGNELKEAYEVHEKAMNELEKRRYIRDELKKAREAYIEVMRHIEYVNYIKCNW